MDMNAVKQRIYELALQVTEDEGVELVGVDISGGGRRLLLKVVIDKEGGVTVSDCEKISRSLEALLDVEDPVKGSYILEVSSPGLDRPLLSKKDFEKNIGKLARIVTIEKIDNQTFFVGRINDVGDGWIRLGLETKEGIKDIFIPIEKISKARLEIEF